MVSQELRGSWGHLRSLGPLSIDFFSLHTLCALVLHSNTFLEVLPTQPFTHAWEGEDFQTYTSQAHSLDSSCICVQDSRL